MLLRDKRIFIVEDNPENRVIAQMLLEASGAQVFVSRSGYDLLYQLENLAPIHLILLDLILPNHTSGYDLYEAIRASPNYSQIPILAISSTDPAEGIGEARRRGFNGYIMKPINFFRFAEQIAAALNGSPVWGNGL
ncbi:MAG: response regulator [Anaerolineales bacterium]|nr:response regulator [Anaerolineales bacterium]